MSATGENGREPLKFAGLCDRVWKPVDLPQGYHTSPSMQGLWSPCSRGRSRCRSLLPRSPHVCRVAGAIVVSPLVSFASVRLRSDVSAEHRLVEWQAEQRLACRFESAVVGQCVL